MRHIYCIFLLLTVFSAYSQTLRLNSVTNQNLTKNDSLWYSDQEYTNHVFGQLNFAEVTSNFLLQRSLSYFEPLAYDGKMGDDSIVKNFGDGMNFYSTLYYAALDTAASYALPHPTIIRDRVKIESTQDFLPILLISRRYHSIASDALLSGLFSTNNDSTALYDVAGRPSSPYRQHRLFTAFGYTESDVYRSNGDVKFKIAPTSLTFTDTTSTSLQIDFADGNGYVNVNLNSTKEVFYNSSGLKTIRVKQGELECSFQFNFVKSEIFFEPVPNDSPELSLARVTTSTASTSTPLTQTFLGCDRILDKPILVVDGFNIQESHTAAEDLLERLNRFRLVTSLMNQGYDFVTVRFSNNSASIIENATALRLVIEQVNDTKSGSNKLHVIGLSMGGLIAKYCLKDMEDKSISHNVQNYFSYDSPHQGAYVPIGLQYLIEDASFAVKTIRENPDVVEMKEKLGSPAAKQLLQVNNYDSANFRAAFASSYASKGYPNLCNKYGIANGRGDGVGVGYSGGSQLMELNASVKAKVLGKVLKHKQQLWALNTFQSAISHLSNKGLAAVLGLKGLKAYSSTVSGYALQSFETIPGSLAAFHFPYGNKLNQGFDEEGESSVDFFGRETSTFVPTVSALDLNNQSYGMNGAYISNNPYYNVAGNEAAVLANHITPFNDIIYSIGASQEHLTIDERITNFIITKIYGSAIPTVCQSICNNIPTFVGATQDCNRGERAITMSNAPVGVAINWVMPAGLTIVSGQGTNKVRFFANTNGPFTGYVELTRPGCATMNFPFSVSTAPVIAGPEMVCDEATFSIPNLPVGATITWSVDSYIVDFVDARDNQITLVRAENGFFKLKAEVSTNCGVIEVQTATITSGQPYSVTAEAYCEEGCWGGNVLCTEGGSVPEANNILTYQVNNSNPVFPLTINYRFNPESGYGFLEGSQNLNNTSGYIYLPKNLETGIYYLEVWVTGGPCQTPCVTSDMWIEVASCYESRKVVAYPNPTTTELKIGLSSPSAEKSPSQKNVVEREFDVKLFDEQGHIVKVGKCRKGEQQITLPVADLQEGTYYLHTFQGKLVDRQQIIIKR